MQSMHFSLLDVFVLDLDLDLDLDLVLGHMTSRRRDITVFEVEMWNRGVYVGHRLMSAGLWRWIILSGCRVPISTTRTTAGLIY